MAIGSQASLRLVLYVNTIKGWRFRDYNHWISRRSWDSPAHKQLNF